MLVDKLVLLLGLVFCALFGMIGFILIFTILRIRNRNQRYEMDKQRWLYELEARKLRIASDAREILLNEISEDIHDNIGQLIFLLKMNVHGMRELAVDSDQARMRDMADDVLDLAERIIISSKHIARSLNGDFVKARGLYRSLEADMESINATGKIKATIDTKGNLVSFPGETELLLYRIAQEAMHNAIKYANAKKLHIELAYYTDHFMMSISDDGQGFEADKINEDLSMGLKNMRSRGEVLGGKLEIASQRGAGCVVSVVIPRAVG